jgi:hypothetical protein
MGSKLTIIEARELAVQGKTVICHRGFFWEPKDFLSNKEWHPDNVFGVWREKREPRRVYVLVDSRGIITEASFSRIALEPEGTSKRIVEFVEVIGE